MSVTRKSTPRVQPVDLKCEYEVNPIGIDVKAPRLSWSLTSNHRAQKQTAYQIIVATSQEHLRRGEGDLWDSGKVESDETIHIAYEGKHLSSRTRCYWQVKVWSGDGDHVAESEIAFWEMGLLEPEDWKADWIGVRTGKEAPKPDISENHWVWSAGRDAGQSPAEDGRYHGFFRRRFDLPQGVGIKKAWLLINGDSLFRQYLNGLEISRATFFVRNMQWVDLTYLLNPGSNVLAVEASKADPVAGIIGRLMVDLENGQTMTLDIDESWKSSQEREHGWETPEFDDKRWQPAVVVARYGEEPWGELVIERRAEPSPFLRRSFTADKEISRARLYVTALGVLDVTMNGQRVSDALFAPEWTDYKKRVMVQTYDVTDLLTQGDNVLGAVLGDGWYAGYVGMVGREVYGTYPLGLLAQLEIEYTDGTGERIVTDDSWEGRSGPIVSSDMLMGEIYDAREDLPGWNLPQAVNSSGSSVNANGENRSVAQDQQDSDESWLSAQVLKPEIGKLISHVGPKVRVTERLRPVSINRTGPETVVLDLGQNMVGSFRLNIRGAESGRRIILRFAEMLKNDGRLYMLNMRTARQMDTYICKGEPEEVFEPRFTFHGFRYVEIIGYPGELSPDDFEAHVIHSDTPMTGHFSSSHPMVNQLQQNIVWGQRGNFLSVPTDCPQRDERLGWLGDAQVFIRTASFNADTAGFFTKWMDDVVDAQHPDGAFVDTAPYVGWVGAGTAAWADAGVIVPWTIYQSYGDTRIIERHYDAMALFIDYMKENSTDLIRPEHGYGDWLSVGADTPKDVIGTAYFAYSTKLMSLMAAVIGKTEDAKTYEDLFEQIKKAFNEAFVTEDGKIKGDTQTSYLLGLRMDLLSEENRRAAVRHLAEDIRKRGNRLSTGFVGCSYLLPELTDGGELDLAYKLLLSTEYPSWGYSIEQGATTMWERWDSYKADGTFQDVGMNSFNHYAYGSVGEWMYRYVAGIEIDRERPGYKHVIIQPHPGGGLTTATASYNSMRGPISVDWNIEQDTFTLKVSIPANTTATVYMPAHDPESVLEGDIKADQAVGVKYTGSTSGDIPRAIYEVESGDYVFRSR